MNLLAPSPPLEWSTSAVNDGCPSTTRRRFIGGIPALSLAAVAAHAAETPVHDIVFGSCLDTHDHPMLDQALKLPRDVFVFMGDNIYADKGGVPMMKEKYALLKGGRFFQGLRRKGHIVATWDDHDFGQNDGGADYPKKVEAQVEFWDWLDEPKDSHRRQQAGVYSAQSFGPSGKRVQIILLDTRYFRSPLKKVPKEQAMLGGTSVPNDDPQATLLGAEQWAWLEKQLSQPADLRLVISSIQFAPEAHGGECWANFPLEQRRFMQLVEKTKAAGVVFLSGDRHWCEFSKLDRPAGYPLYDFTSSSMTQKHPRGSPTVNRNRFLPRTYHLPNVGHLHIDWDKRQISVNIIGMDGKTQLSHHCSLDELQPN